MSDTLNYAPQPNRRPSLVAKLLRFGGVSALSLVLNVGGSWVLYGPLGWPPEAAYGLSLVVVFVVNFVLFRRWVFKADADDARRQFGGYLISSLSFRLGEYLAFLGLHGSLRLPPLPTILAISCVATVLKFLVFNGKVFRTRTSE